MYRQYSRIGAIFLCFVFSSRLLAEVALGSLFSDGMVVQHNEQIAVWGTASENERVIVSFRGKTATALTHDGKWIIRIAAGRAGGPFEMNVQGKNEISVHNILVGEVWLASGQSNMMYTLGRPNIPPEVLADAKRMASSVNGSIHYFIAKPRGADEPKDDVIGNWTVAAPDNIELCSAVAWYFGVALQTKLKVPIGLIISSVGNTPAEAWIPRPEFDATSVAPAIWERHRQALAAVPPGAADRYQKELTEWLHENPTPKLQFDNANTHPVPPYTATDGHIPCRFYNGMIHGLEPYTFRGVIWYQGGSNAMHAREYAELIKTLIQSWRAHWHSDFPFYYVEETNFGKAQSSPVEDDGSYGNLALLREMQGAALELPATGVATSVDLLRPGDSVHFPIKKPVGDRLANLALARTYRLPMGLVDGPEFEGYRIDANKVRLRLKFANGLRVRGGGEPRGFAIRSATSDWVWAQVRIEGRGIEVWNDAISSPTAVRYAWAGNPIISIENNAGLPARPFRTDKESGDR